MTQPFYPESSALPPLKTGEILLEGYSGHTLITLPDGSLTLQDAETGELYHNKVGALEEALHHYVVPSDLPGLMTKTQDIKVLDACFGLGYNSWQLLCSLLDAAPMYWPHGGRVTVWAIEQDETLLDVYPSILSLESYSKLKKFWAPLEHNIHYQTQMEGGLKKVQILSGIENGVSLSVIFVATSLRLSDGFWPILNQEIGPSGHLVFHDPFSPRRMPSLWTLELFQQYAQWLRPEQGRLLTYSSANAIRSALIQAGFGLYKTLPLGAKTRGGLCGVMSSFAEDCPSDFATPPGLVPLSLEELDKLAGSAGVVYQEGPPGESVASFLQRRDEAQETLLPFARPKDTVAKEE